MNRIILLAFLATVGSAAAISNTLESLMNHPATRVTCEQFSAEERAALDAYLTELEVIIFEANRDAAYLSSVYTEGSALMKELIGADQLACQIMFSPAVQTALPLESEQEPRFVS